MKRFFQRKSAATRDILFCIADHYEPNFGKASPAVQAARVDRWVNDYPKTVDGFKDADGHPPRHTFFFPAEAYESSQLNALSDLCKAGYGEVEVHLHHGNDTSAGVRRTLSTFRDTLVDKHDLLSKTREGHVKYGFIHGNWALDNGHLDDRFCGVNDELTVLAETGCYADFTMPAAPDYPQSVIVNSIYYTRDDPGPRSYDRGYPSRVGSRPEPQDMLMVNGPLGLYSSAGRPLRLENSALDASPAHHPTLARFRRWISTGISVIGREEWIVVKVYSHGAKEDNASVLLGDVARQFHTGLATHFNDGTNFRLHYVTAREIYNIVKAAEAGMSGNAGQYRDYELIPTWRATR